MPKGSYFICDNEECKAFKGMITIHNVWPLMDIDMAIEESEGERKQILEERKKQGRKFSLFVYPQDKDKTPLGYRIQLFCPKDMIVFDKEFVKEEEATLSEMNPPVCVKCGGNLLSEQTAIDDGIDCPSCGKKLKPLHWFAKQK
jgi:hypothetical protein